MLTEQQLKERKNYIGGSDVAAILGYSKWKTPIDVFLEKTTDYRRFPEDKNRLAKNIGNILEDVIAEDYCINNKISLLSCISNQELKSHQIDFFIGHPDRIIRLDTHFILEIKTAHAKNEEWGEPGTDQIPIDYLYQVAFYCWLGGIEKAIILVYFKNTGTIEEFAYTRNEVIEEEMSEGLPMFWNEYVIKNEMPPAIRATDISHVYKSIGTIKLDVDKHQILTAMQQYKYLTEAIKSLNEQKEELREKIVLSLGGYGQIVNWDNEKIGTFTSQFAKRVDIEKLKKEHPQIYESCLKESYSQVLRIR
jgi:putative phage-type endonuclease